MSERDRPGEKARYSCGFLYICFELRIVESQVDYVVVHILKTLGCNDPSAFLL